MAQSGDQRSVTTDALHTLGTKIGPDEHRDAIHLAVEPAVASGTVFPGQHVGRLVDGRYSPQATKLVGIVDPFLKDTVYPGERFWLIVYPRQITSLRHVWEHPDFPTSLGTVEPAAQSPARPATTVAESHAALEAVAVDAGLDYAALIEGANRFLDQGRYLIEGGRWDGFRIPDDFWWHFERVTGRRVPEGERGNFFSCSC